MFHQNQMGLEHGLTFKPFRFEDFTFRDHAHSH